MVSAKLQSPLIHNMKKPIIGSIEKVYTNWLPLPGAVWFHQPFVVDWAQCSILGSHLYIEVQIDSDVVLNSLWTEDSNSFRYVSLAFVSFPYLTTVGIIRATGTILIPIFVDACCLQRILSCWSGYRRDQSYWPDLLVDRVGENDMLIAFLVTISKDWNIRKMPSLLFPWCYDLLAIAVTLFSRSTSRSWGPWFLCVHCCSCFLPF